MKTPETYINGTLFIAVVTMIVLLSTKPGNSQDWFDTDWNYRRAVAASNTAGYALADFQVQITLDASFDFSDADPNGNDIRFTEDDGISLLSYWIEDWDVSGSHASLWVKLPSIPISGATLYLYYGNLSASSASDGTAAFEFFDDFEINLAKWTVSGGTWTTIETTEQNGSTGYVAQGTTTGIQLLQSIGFSGTDYVLEGYGKQVSDRQWGLCTRVTSSDNFYLSMLYEDLDATNNLYLYIWQPTIHPNQNTAVGVINMNTWYKMTIKVYDDTVSTYIDDVEELTVEDATHTSGGIALLGNNNTVAQFNDIRVRKYSASEPTSSVGIEESQPSTIDIAIFHTTCGDFEVKLRPSRDITDNYLTNIQFTLKWPANTVNLNNFYSDFGVSLQSVSIENDTNYAIFASAAYSGITWTTGSEYTILTLSHDYSAIDSTDFIIETGTWATNNYGEYYIEVFGADFTGAAYANANDVYLGRCGEFKVLLQGPHSGAGLMKKGLSANIPLSQPYNVEPWNYDGAESVGTVDGSVVDWVLLELRSDINTVEEQKAALLLDDGMIVQYNNVTHGVHFDNTPDGSSYFVVVHHRNHMPVMTGVLNVFDGSFIDFTDESICYGSPNAEIELETSIYGMIAGDVTSDGILQYSGPGNDRGSIIAKIIDETGSTNINDLITDGYWFEDANMNDTVLYIGSDNDRSYINSNLNALVGPELNNIYSSPVPGMVITTKESIGNNGSFDIQLAESNSIFQVEITNSKLVKNGLVDNIQFTLVWKVGDTEIAELLNSFSSEFMLAPQGNSFEFENNIYQVYASVTPVNLPQSFNEGEKVEVITFHNPDGILIEDRIWIANDDYTSANNGNYYVSVWGNDNTGIIKLKPLNLNENSLNNSIHIYPNPVLSGKTHVEINLSEASNVNIEILDVHGKLVFSQTINVNGGLSNNQIDFKELPAGMYYIRIKTKNLTIIKKLILM